MPEVSIIVPNYNHGRFLEERLESIFGQTFQDFEVILLDDCSTDNSVEILKKYAGHPKVREFRVNDHNSGSPFKQWRQGIALAGGEYIWIAESDDYADKNFLATLVPALKSNPRLGLAYCQSKVVGENSEIIGEYSSYSFSCPERWKNDFTNSGTDEICSYLLRINTIPNASAAIVRKAALADIIVPDNLKTMGDWYVWLKVLSRWNVFYTAKPLNCFRRSSQSTRQNCSFVGRQERIFQAIELTGQLAREGALDAGSYRKAVLCRLDSWAYEYFLANHSGNDFFYVLKRFPALKKYAPHLIFYYIRHKLHLRSRLMQHNQESST
jgi:glycosyltransferase involved in cell wall biosynthesis